MAKKFDDFTAEYLHVTPRKYKNYEDIQTLVYPFHCIRIERNV